MASSMILAEVQSASQPHILRTKRYSMRWPCKVCVTFYIVIAIDDAVYPDFGADFQDI